MKNKLSHFVGCLAFISVIGFSVGCQSPLSTANRTASSSTANSTIYSNKAKVEISDYAFSPNVIHVTTGTTVTWTNEDSMSHTVTSKTGLFNPQDLPNGKSFSFRFTKPGTYQYVCAYHLAMTGTVIVSSQTSTPNTSSTMDMSSTATSVSKDNIAPFGTGTTGEPKQADDIRLLPYTIEDGYKVFHLTAEPVWWQVEPEKKVEAWAYNGSVPGPEIKGDKVKIIVKNDLPEGATVHWHGLDVPFSQDGSGGISQPDIKPGQTWTYSFTVTAPAGTYMYHSHPMKDMQKQEDMGLFGPFIVEPKGTGWKQVHPGYQEEYTLMVNDSPEFGYTINGLSYPATPVLPAKVGDKVLVHLINIGTMDHPMHLHGIHFQELSQDGYPLPAPVTMDTIDTAPGTTYDLSFVADQPGKWLFHCHIAAHTTDSNGNMSRMITMFNVTN